MATLTGADIKRGDVLLCKSFSLMPDLTHLIIRTGQSTFPPETGDIDTPLAGRTFTNSVHAEIALSTGDEEVEIAESTAKGVRRDVHKDVEAYVFRLRVRVSERREACRCRCGRG